MPLCMHWAQVWGTVKGQKWRAITGTTIEDHDGAELGKNAWGTELACLPPCPTGAHTHSGPYLPSVRSGFPDTQVQDCLWIITLNLGAVWVLHQNGQIQNCKNYL